MMKNAKNIAIIFIWLLIWQALSIAVNESLLLVSPLETAERLLQLAQLEEFWQSIFLSLDRIMRGFLLALAVGALLAIASARFWLVYDFLRPLMTIIQAIPVASFIILALIWIKSDKLSTFCSFLMVLPVVYNNLYQGLTNVSQQLIEVGQVFGFSRFKMFEVVYLPSVLPYLISSCNIGMGMAWKSGVAAEVIGLPNRTIGIHLYDAKVYLETPDLFAWTLVIVILGMVMEWLLQLLLRRLDYRQKVKRKNKT